MEANELRLGNFVKFPHNEKPLMVNHRIIHDLYNGMTKYDPIPLTEEWLNNFGFQLDQYVEIESIIDEVAECDLHLEMEYGERGTVICISSDHLNESMSIPLKHIKFVHQFQNIYFALKGKELKLEQS